ncbi:MAG: UvrD-helicase domain-containing protein [Defluviitaleaceae bacterium]|nr:UvrD-helicase domain-containing protein [Defluviitaleaceae bacterium]
MNYLSKLNPAQREAVLHTEGPLLVFAGAGSGKTRVLTYRVAHLIEKGVDPYHIIAITFTNKAASEMRERISAITPLGEQVWVSTFHAACTRILRREIDALGYGSGFTIYDAADSERLIKECIKELNLNDKDYPPRKLSEVISTQKNELITPQEFEAQTAGYYRDSNMAEVYTLYQKKLKASNALDFDDIIMQTVNLLTNHENVRNKYQNRFRYVLIDEYQDTNHAQYRLVNLLVGSVHNICVVGDDDQSIYGWRGANIENILNFEKDYPNAKIIKLEENYRSTQRILNAANAVISKNDNRATKNLWTQNNEGPLIKLHTAASDKEEGAFVANVIKTMTMEDATYSDFAVLYRTNAQSRAIEDQLVLQGLPYRLFGGVRFYERMEIKDVLSYLKAINNPADDLAYTRIINVPRRGIGATTITKIQNYAAEMGIPFSQAMADSDKIPGLKNKGIKDFAGFMAECAEFAKHKPVSALMTKILEETGYYRNLNDGTIEGEGRMENVDELLSKASQFERESEDSTLGRFLEDVALVADIDSYQEDSGAVSLMTLHSAKGLEFNTVFVVGMEENIFPSSRAARGEDPTALEEERRLCYVGFTRARQSLYISHAMKRLRYDGFHNNPPSRFLKDVPVLQLEQVNMFGRSRQRVTPSHGLQDSQQREAMLRQAPPQREVISRQAPPQPRKIIQFPEKLNQTTNVQHPSYNVGDIVIQPIHGIGKVTEMKASGPDYEVTVYLYKAKRNRKYISKFSNLEKYDEDKHMDQYGPMPEDDE